MDAPNKPDICEETEFEGARAIVCVVDPARHHIALVYRDRDATPYGSVARAVAGLAADGRTPLLAMNAGMYHADMTPVGLYAEEGVEFASLNSDDGFGNFFLKPNGVFFVLEDGRAGVLETEAYAAAAIAPAFASQSGPMLVIDGALHPRFLPDGSSKYIRNGAGVRADGKVVLAITRDPVSLGSFGRLFRDVAKCPNALFFDGAVSSLAWGGKMEIDAGEPAGPVVAVFGKDQD
ncbi:phosphodiester glycosidase family protein [Hoeflea sp. YIM 152468]|uniref:phosphodiester glycosidase family protein n=1 Tax=Hoeflea sp. YIM 152468 TaxID=3031759 RepID=UPI0023D98AD6|nr:phosphodiester glycosidase family protein [Hoeflea sp. YIM 152468]MDF1607463.1 phosphodiester glycosidase family protein [Hoeflea sp. YIM 152468]